LLLFLWQHNPCPLLAQDPEPKAAPGLKEAYERVLLKAEDEYRLMFRRPETIPEFWTAITFEIDLGKYDIAALLLKQMLEKEPAAETDKELVRIEEARGLATFLRLRRIRQWSKHPLLQKEAETNVENLIARVTGALEKHLADPQRIGKFIKNLDAPTVEERAYAFQQLNRSRDRAVPYLVEALRSTFGTPLNQKIRDALIRLDGDVVPPLIAALTARDAKDAQDIDLRVALLGILKTRGDKRAVPDLWHITAAPKYPPFVRQRARETLAHLLETQPDKLPPARNVLVEQAERFERHQNRYIPARLSQEERKAFEERYKDQPAVAVWKWGEKGLTRDLLTTSQADAHYGLRYAREALEIDPSYPPAQSLFLILALQQAYGPRLDQALLQPTPPALQQLLATIDGDLLDSVLERALTEGDLPVILGAVQAIGERGELRLARPSANVTPRGLVRALYYPDRRVQMAAARALLRIPSMQVPVASSRVVEVLRRFLAADPVPKVLLLFIAERRIAELRKAVKEAGFEPVFAASAKEAFELLHRSADFDAILINYTAPQSELPYLLSQLRADVDVGRLPVLLISPPDRMRPSDAEVDVLARQQFQRNLASLAEQHRHVWVIPEAATATADQLKPRLDYAIKVASLPERMTRFPGPLSPRLEQYTADVKGQLSPAERKQYTREALEVLSRMARGELAGYDLRPCQQAVARALHIDDLAVQAAEIMSRLPGTEPQEQLAAIVLNPKHGKVRIAAAVELNRHVQKYGLLLPQLMNPDQLKQLRAIADNPDEDPALRAQVAILNGRMPGTARQTGVRLYQFRPDADAPARKE
jgi:CheY-like chemotaxis protein